MSVVLFLLFFPLLVGGLVYVIRNATVRGIITRIAALFIAAASILFAVMTLNNGLVFHIESEWLSWFVLSLDAGMALIIIVLGLKHKKYLAPVLTLLQVPLLAWFELTHGEKMTVGNDIFVDRLSVILVLIIGIVGGLITIYTVSYMKDYHYHHQETKDRTSFFLAILFIFLSAMFGIVISNNLTWMYFFWEVTTLCSFLLIGYTRTKEAIDNSFTALVMNLIGSIGFVLAILYIGMNFNTVEMTSLLKLGINGTSVVVPAALLAFAGIAKAAQLPFSNWLLGAMVAPTPSSALLHSSTMVKAGVFIIIRLAPVLSGQISGLMVALVGGITFLIASLAAISQMDAKKLLAWSTIANLGLIVACGGIGTYEAVWAGMLLIIFHAVSKSLLFLSVGTIEHNLGSRSIEDMHGLIMKLPEMAVFLTIGIAGMFLAPFGMLISKWAALRAFIDSNNIVVLMALVFGSAATLFYWTKWLGKIVAVLGRSERLKNDIKRDEWFALGALAILTIGLCFIFPVISNQIIEPYFENIYGQSLPSILSAGNTHLMLLMLGMVLLMPIVMYIFIQLKDDKIVTSYMGGVNRGDNRSFVDSFGKSKEMYLSNWYMDKVLSEKTLSAVGIVITAAILSVVLLMALGGVL